MKNLYTSDIRHPARMYLPFPEISYKYKLVIGLVSLLAAAPTFANEVAVPSEPQQEFEWVIESVGSISRNKIHSGDFISANKMQSAYESNSYRPLWKEHIADPAWLDDAIKSLSELRYDALPTSRYKIKDLQALRDQPEQQWLLDMRLTDAIITAIDDLNGQLLSPELLGSKWNLKTEAVDSVAQLQKIKFDKPVSELIQSQRPNHQQYAKLRNKLKELTNNPSQPLTLADGDKLLPGDTGDRVYQLAQRLAAENLLDSAKYGQDAVYDAEMTAAVRRFQKSRGLKPDGITGGLTRRTLNTHIDDVALKVSLNLQRWRAAPKAFPTSHILVNTAAYRMELQDNGKKALEMDVVVGKRDRQTPSFTESMTNLVLNPNWNIPKRITTEEILPKLRDDPEYAAQQNIRALIGNKPVPWSEIAYEEFWEDEFPYRLQQTSGATNSLGKYKFMFPNRYAVYLHDTPYKSLFAKHNRAYSHGCVRLAEPNKLANYLLAKKGWSEAKVARAVNSGKRKTVELDEPLQVYLMYLTSWVNDEGTLELYPDIYRHDRHMTSAVTALLHKEEHNHELISVASWKADK